MMIDEVLPLNEDHPLLKEKHLPPEEQIALWKKYKEENDIDSRNRLVETNMRLAFFLIKKRVPLSLQEDALQETTFSIIRSIEKYNPNMGGIINYMHFWIRSSICRFLRNNRFQSTNLLFNKQSIDSLKSISNQEMVLFDNYEWLERKIMCLDEREKHILCSYNGILNYDQKILRKITPEIGMCYESVRKIYIRALEKLKDKKKDFVG